MKKLIIGILLGLALIATVLTGCEETQAPKGDVKRVAVDVNVQASGLTIEQENVKNRLEQDNKPGSIKHLYVISAYSGDVIIYSTVTGKVTSSGKRLTPYEYTGASEYGGDYANVDVRGENVRTPEVMQDDGTYGSSAEYIFWWDTKGIYHQHYIAGGQIVHVSSEPIAVPKIIINMSK